MNESTPWNDLDLPSMIDTHCHLDDLQFADDLPEVLARSRNAGVTRWVLIGYDPNRWHQVTALAQQIDGMSHTIGVHPSCAEQWNEDTAQELSDLAERTNAVAIGECGLDFYRDNAAPDIQERVFVEQLKVAQALGLPVIIHMRSAENEILQILERQSSLPTLVFHSFDGTEKLMDFALETESYIGMGGLATRQGSDQLRKQLLRVHPERLLVETDSPYLVPARQKDRRNQPVHIATILSMMADHLGTTPAALAEQTTRNAERVFGLDHE